MLEAGESLMEAGWRMEAGVLFLWRLGTSPPILPSFSVFWGSLVVVEAARKTRCPFPQPHSTQSPFLRPLLKRPERRRFPAPLPESRPLSRHPPPRRRLLPSLQLPYRLHSMGPLCPAWGTAPQSRPCILATPREDYLPRTRRRPSSQPTSGILSRRLREIWRNCRRVSWHPRVAVASLRPSLLRHSWFLTPSRGRAGGFSTHQCGSQ